MSSASTSSQQNEPAEIYFTCLWRKPQARKHKTWEGDGVLCIKGSSCTIRSSETGLQIASGSWPHEQNCEPGKILMVSGKEVELDEPISPKDLAKYIQVQHHEADLPLQTRTSLPQRSNSTQNINLKFKCPLKVASSSTFRNPECVIRSRFFANSALSQPFNTPSFATANTKKREREEIGNQSSECRTAPITVLPHILSPLSSRPRLSLTGDLHETQKSNENQSFVCLYRRLTGLAPKKKLTWDGDGILCLSNSQRGTMAVLKDLPTDKVLASMLLGTNLDFQPQALVKVGSREVQIQRSATDSEIKDLEQTAQRLPETDWAEVVKPDSTCGMFKSPMVLDNSRNALQSHLSSGDLVVLTKPNHSWMLKHNTNNATVVDVVVDPVLIKSLKPHQLEGLKFMYECTMGMRDFDGNGCILADEMGLGKSVQAISLLWTLLRQNPIAGQGPVVKRAMIVCPVTLAKNWQREIYKWLGRSRLNVFVADGKCNIKQFTCSLFYKVLIIGYEKLRTLGKELNCLHPPIGLIIADEGHRLKSIEAKTTQALRSLNTIRRVVLSGTPIQNNLTEYYSMVDFVNPGILNDHRTFKKTFEQPILKSREPHCTLAQRSQGEARAEELATMSRSFVLRRGSEVIAQYLPPRHDYCVFVSPTLVQRKIYEAILDSTEIRAVFSGDTSQHLVLINTLKKLCNSPGLLMNENSIKTLKQNSSELFPPWVTRDDIQLSGKLLALSEFLKALKKRNEEKIILVSNFTSTLDIIETHCKEMNYSFCRLDGKTPQNQRDNIVQVFNGSSPRAQFIFLLSSKSGGVGLNLIGASRLILFDGDWNPATDLQAMARIWRQGQKKTCHIYRFLTTGTIDECVFQRQITKMGLATDLMHKPKPGEEVSNSSNAFTKSELRRLFELHADTKCYTHDLLDCGCLSQKKARESEDEDSLVETGYVSLQEAEYDSEASLPGSDLVAFMPASQFRASAKPETTKMKKKLAELETWLHVDPTDPTSLDDLDDDILNETISNLSLDTPRDYNSVNCDELHKGTLITFVFSKAHL
ncbi:hypothetical protein O181_005950 [Austropuccinia psidii MF-1]|uniref:DNA repair and recombination protein RAD54B n=1 Tax=Austropuccinia psidii MF-1 TaxID=1389203 RepID=A0A9Q3BJE0_9BASI|nr:hypothetical protein [Austropuccinia psidii MF-1]